MKLKLLSVILGIFIIAFAAKAATIDVNVLQPNGGEFISQANGSYAIQYSFSDSNSELDYNASLYYAYNPGSGYVWVEIAKDIDIRAAGNCSGNDFINPQTCHYDWNTAGINGRYLIYIPVKDSEGSFAYDYSDGYFTVDNTPPSGLSIIINNGASLTNSTEASLRLSASGDTNKMQFSCDNSSFGEWQNYSPNSAFNMNSGAGCYSGDGLKTVYFRAKDRAGNVSNSVSDSITLDSTPPSIQAIEPNAYSNNKRQPVKALISDSLSGINSPSIKFYLNGTAYNIGDFPTHTLSFSTDTNILTFTPKFDYAQLVAQNVSIDANDNAKNKATEQFSFKIDSNAMLQITSLGAEVSGSGIYLEWQKPGFEGADLDFYKVYRATTSIPSEAAKAAFYYASTTSTYFTDSNVLKERTYHYYVTSVDLAGNESILSNEEIVDFQGLVKLSADKNSIAMEEGTSYGIEFTILNDTSEAQDISLSAVTDDADLDAELLTTRLSLNKNESTEFTLSIIAQDGVDSGSHEIAVRAYYDGITVEYLVNVLVGDADLVSFGTASGFVCNDSYTVRLPVNITNLTGSSKDISLTAFNNTFLPRWENSTIHINAGETETLDILLNNTPSNELTGEYTIQVTGKSGSRTAVAELSFTMEDCKNNGIMNFTLEVDSSIFSISKGTAKRVGYSIRNNSDNEGYINVSIETDLSTDYNSLVYLNDNSTYYDYAVVRAGMFDEPKKYDFKIRAYNEDFERTRTISINVLKTHYFEFSSAETDMTIMQGQSKSIGLEFRNADYAESFTLRHDSNDSKVDVEFDEDSFSMDPRTLKESSFSISAAEDARPGLKTVKIKAKTGSVSEKTIELKVRVIGAAPQPPTGQELVVESYPLEVSIRQGQSRELAFTLYNASSESVAFASVSIEGLPEGVSAERASEVISPGQRALVKIKLKASDSAETGDFDALALIDAFGSEQSKEFSLKVSGKEQGFLEGIWTGFLSLGESVFLGVIALLVIIVLLVLLGRAAGPEKPKEAWMQK